MFGGVCECESRHPPTTLLAWPPCPEDCVWPSGGHNPRMLSTWKRSTIGGEKGPRTSDSTGTWPGPGQTHLSQPGFLGDRFLSFFFMVAQLCPMGGPFLHTARPSFLGGLLHMSCGSAGSCLGGKLQIKYGLSQRLVCSLAVLCVHVLHGWPPSGPLTLHQTRGQRTTFLDHLFGEVGCRKNRECRGWGLAQRHGVGPQIPGEPVGGNRGRHYVLEDCPRITGRPVSI